MKTPLLLVGLLGMLAPSLLVGCTGTGPGGTPYIIRADRKLAATVEADLAATHHVAVNVLENELLYTVTDQALDAREGIIRGRTARKHSVRVDTYKLEPTATNIFIFVAPFGDTPAQVEIFERIEDQLLRYR